MESFAHSLDESHPMSAWEKLATPLAQVGEGTVTRVVDALGPDHPLVAAAWAAGLLHDLGKYRVEFQYYIRGLRKGDLQTQHKEAGAARALGEKNAPAARPPCARPTGWRSSTKCGGCWRSECPAAWFPQW